MIERRNVPANNIHGEYYINTGTSGVKKGTWALASGTWSAAAGPTGYVGYPGYANSGDKKLWSLESLADAIATGFGVADKLVIVDKLEFQPEDGDLTLDALVSGEACICYDGGVFETDRYKTTDTWTSVYVGQELYVDADGLLTSSYLVGQVSRARYKGQKSGYDSNFTTTSLIMFEVLNEGHAGS